MRHTIKLTKNALLAFCFAPRNLKFWFLFRNSAASPSKHVDWLFGMHRLGMSWFIPGLRDVWKLIFRMRSGTNCRVHLHKKMFKIIIAALIILQKVKVFLFPEHLSTMKINYTLAGRARAFCSTKNTQAIFQLQKRNWSESCTYFP